MSKTTKYRSAITGRFVRSAEGKGVSSSRTSANEGRVLAKSSLRRAAASRDKSG